MRKNTSLLRNKPLGHLGALLFFGILAYGLYMSASKMNYVWQWNAIPKYFFFLDEKVITAEYDGVLVKENGQIILKNTAEDADLSENTIIEQHYELMVAVGETFYEDEDIARFSEYQAGPIMVGLWVTLQISFLAAILSFLIGSLVALMRISGVVTLEDIASLYISVIRGTPLLVQIFLFYFIVANLLSIERFWAGVLSLSIFFGAYSAEIIRGAIESVDTEQYEASKSLGMNYVQTMYYIILPQAFRRALPALTGEQIALIKDSSLVSVISITDLTKVGREIVANTFSAFETWIIIACVYLSITFLIHIAGRKIEEKLKLP